MNLGDSDVTQLMREESLGWHVATLARKMSHDLDTALRQKGLRIAYWPTLFILWEREGLSQRELAEGCMTEHYTTTRILDRLVVMGLVERRADPNSRRTSRIYLTKKGRALEKPLTQLARRINERYLEKLSDKKRGDFLKTLRTLNKEQDSAAV